MRALMLFQSGKEKDKVYGNIAHTELDSSIIPIRFTVKIFLDSSECRCSNIFVAIHNPCGQRGGRGKGRSRVNFSLWVTSLFFLIKICQKYANFPKFERLYLCFGSRMGEKLNKMDDNIAVNLSIFKRIKFLCNSMVDGCRLLIYLDSTGPITAFLIVLQNVANNNFYIVFSK